MDVPRPRRTGWIAYAGLLTVVVVAGELMRDETPGAATLASWVLSTALLVALWSYALQRRLGTERYWRAVFWIVTVATLVMLVPVLLAGGRTALLTLALTLPVVPAYVGAWRYAYRSTLLWHGS